MYLDHGTDTVNLVPFGGRRQHNVETPGAKPSLRLIGESDKHEPHRAKDWRKQHSRYIDRLDMVVLLRFEEFGRLDTSSIDCARGGRPAPGSTDAQGPSLVWRGHSCTTVAAQIELRLPSGRLCRPVFIFFVAVKVWTDVPTTRSDEQSVVSG